MQVVYTLFFVFLAMRKAMSHEYKQENTIRFHQDDSKALLEDSNKGFGKISLKSFSSPKQEDIPLSQNFYQVNSSSNVPNYLSELLGLSHRVGSPYVHWYNRQSAVGNNYDNLSGLIKNGQKSLSNDTFEKSKPGFGNDSDFIKNNTWIDIATEKINADSQEQKLGESVQKQNSQELVQKQKSGEVIEDNVSQESIQQQISREAISEKVSQELLQKQKTGEVIPEKESEKVAQESQKTSQSKDVPKEVAQKGDIENEEKGRGMAGWQNGGGMMKGGGQQILLIKDKGDNGMEMPTNGMSGKDAIAPLIMMLTPLLMMCIMMPMMMNMMGGMMNLVRGIGMMLIGNMNPMNMMMMMPAGMMPPGAPTRHRKTDEETAAKGRKLLNNFIFEITKKLEAAIDKYESQDKITHKSHH